MSKNFQISHFSTTTNSQKSSQSHYEILQVESTCSEKEIKNSFLKLSKQCHPDVNACPQTTAKFVKILEAYRVLGKKDSRELYDYHLANSKFSAYTTSGEDRWHFHNINRNPGPYYGVKGVKKVSNMKIAGILLGFATFGTILQVVALRNSITLRRDELDEHSREASIQHAKARAAAEKNGNKKQLEKIIEKIHENGIS